MANIDWYLRTNLKFKHLQLLVTLDELRNIGKTAQYLNVSQPAISKTLIQFEEGFNIKLFHRTTRSIYPTEAGQSLINYARSMLKEISNISNELLDITEGRVSRISLGIIPAVSLYLIPKLIAKLENTQQSTKVTITEGSSENLMPMLRTANLDIAITNLTNKTQSIELQSELLYKDPIVVVVGRQHPLCQKNKVYWKNLQNFPMVLPPQFAITRTAIEEFLNSQKIDISSRYVESLSTLTNIGVLNETDSVGFLAKSIASYFEKVGLVKMLNLELPNVYIDIGMVWLKSKNNYNSQQVVLNLIREACRQVIDEY